ncbi:MAG: DUF6036 family nucleotidyltransferase [Verrucomicrobiota bacterium]
MNSDFKELLQIFAEVEVEYLIVGGYAVIHHGQPRATKDLDIWLKPSHANAEKVMMAFSKFGLPLMGGVEKSDFEKEGLQYAVGVPPSMIDFLTTIPGLQFEEAWANRVEENEGGICYLFLGKADLIHSKRVAGRPQDLADISELESI